MFEIACKAIEFVSIFSRSDPDRKTEPRCARKKDVACWPESEVPRRLLNGRYQGVNGPNADIELECAPRAGQVEARELTG